MNEQIRVLSVETQEEEEEEEIPWKRQEFVHSLLKWL